MTHPITDEEINNVLSSGNRLEPALTKEIIVDLVKRIRRLEARVEELTSDK